MATGAETRAFGGSVACGAMPIDVRKWPGPGRPLPQAKSSFTLPIARTSASASSFVL